MCGIAGYILKSPSKKAYRHIPILLNAVRPRGPDDEGVCLISRQARTKKLYKTHLTPPASGASLNHIDDEESIIPHDIGLIHTRYSIIDLTAGGHQPFVSSDNSVVAIFNGEIYNYKELRTELSRLGVRFRTSSDTEVLVEGYRIWKNQVWAKLNGFWAVALYDFNDDSILLSRDRIGVAPLYYRECTDGFYFASSINALIDINPTSIELDADKILGFLQTSIKDFDESTFYAQVKSIPPATIATFRADESAFQYTTRAKYWDMPKSRLTAADFPFDEAVRRYQDTFFNAVELRLRADVKVAFELSGGLDSSSVVAAAATLRNSHITTYTIKVPERDEEPYARSILDRYRVDYHVLSDPVESFFSDARFFCNLMEEPVHSLNIYTHYKMRQQMKDHGVSVVMSGNGGDEVLAGYEWEFWPNAFLDLRTNGHFLHAIRYEVARRFMTAHRARQTIQNGFKRIGRWLNRCGLEPLYSLYRQSLHGPDNGLSRNSALSIQSDALSHQKRYKGLPFHDQAIYHLRIAMIPYYLRSNDHFTMGIPMEHRFPFLDYRMVELGLQMPTAYLFKNGWTKYVLRKAMEPYLPQKILWRKDKMGFPVSSRRLLSNNCSTFEPVLANLNSIGISNNDFGDYDLLLKTNPAQLWRLISTALWLECYAKRLPCIGSNLG